MSRKEQRYLSVEGEPVLGNGEAPELDPGELGADLREHRSAARAPAEIDAIRDSVVSEPSMSEELLGVCSAEKPCFGDWLAVRKQRVRLGPLLLVTLVAGLVAGPFAVVGALFKSGLAGGNFLLGLSYFAVLGPLLEEMLKQSGALFLLERRPYWLRYSWQFPVMAVISAGLFATIENVMYINGPIAELSGEAYTAAVNFRWRYCTLLHVGCSLIAARGMSEIWRRQVVEEAPARLSVGYPWIVTAVIVHGVYNLSVTFWAGP